jgi:dipeptidyl-peptidase III
MNANNNPTRLCHYVPPSEVKEFRDSSHFIRFNVTAIHELLGHGTGKLLTETAPGEYNFDKRNLPINPLTGETTDTWYGLGQTWTSVFEKLATTVEECRAMLVSYYLVDNKEVLSMFGYVDKSAITAHQS